MLRILRNAEVYAPEHLGKRDILIADRRIAAIAETVRGARARIPAAAPDHTVLAGLEPMILAA